MKEKSNFLQMFDGVEDPRTHRRRIHPLESILGLGLLGALAGVDSFIGLQDFAEMHENLLKDIIPFPAGTPSHDTIGRVFSLIDVTQFHNVFFTFTDQLSDKIKGLIAVDGKTARNSGDENPLHVVSAWSEANKLALGQVKTNSKSNEITAIPMLLDMLDLDGNIISIDAMGCQKNIAQQIIEKNGDYLLALKANQKNLYEDVMAYFEDDQDPSKVNYWEEVDKGHGRIEKRQCWALSDIDWLKKYHVWEGLTTIAAVRCERTIKGKKSSQIRFYISSLHNDAELICKAARMHWGIENKLHWCLDVVFNEDKSCIRNDNAPEIMSIMRKWALNIHNSTKPKTVSLKRSMAKCYMSPKHAFTILKGL